MRKVLTTAILLLASIPLSLSAAGFDDNYIVRTGDLSGDGDIDVYLQHKPTIVVLAVGDINIPIPLANREVGQFYLENQSDGSFSIQTLTSSQLRQVRTWPVADIFPSVWDLNLDGALDVLLAGVADEISGAEEAIVFSSAVNGEIPMHVTPFDASVRDFFREVWNWRVAPVVTETTEVPDYTYLGYAANLIYDLFGNLVLPTECLIYDDCWPLVFDDIDDPGGFDPVNDPNVADVFHWWGWDYVVQTVTRRDYVPTGENAQIVTQILESLMAETEIPAGSFEAAILQNIYSLVFGAPVIDMSDEPTESVDEALEDDWRWWRVFRDIAWVMIRTCDREEEDEEGFNQCLLDIMAPGIPLAVCEASAPSFDYDITATQWSHVSNDKRREFWLSRYTDSCDPFAPAALSVVDEVGLGEVTMEWLRDVADHEGVEIDENKIGLDIMDNHANVTMNDSIGTPHLLSKSQITDYHVEVFEDNDLPPNTFGGAPFGSDSTFGRVMEQVLGGTLWCIGCDPLPSR